MEPQRINAYDCPDGHVLVTRDADHGVTPMFKNCEVCGKTARSRMYTRTEGLTPTHEWYKPKFPERFTDPSYRHHVEQGGLLFRKIGGIDESEYLPHRPPEITDADLPEGYQPSGAMTRAERRELHRKEQKAFKKANRRYC